MGKIMVLLCSILLLFVFSTPAASHELDPKEAGHPLRVTAHVLHPAGYALYHVVIKPAHGLISLPGFAELFGHENGAFEGGRWEKRASGSSSNPVCPETEPRLDEVLERAAAPEAMGSQPPQESPAGMQRDDSRTATPKCNFRPNRAPSSD